jgi:phosphopantothenoylcysteine synthetase/decarboxylase
MSRKSVALVVCGAPLAYRVVDLAAALIEDGWNVTTAATPASLAWLDGARVEKVTGSPPVSAFRQPDQPKRGKSPDQIVVCPLTFNTGSKLAVAIMDNYALGVLCEALAVGTPIVAVSMISERLWRHPGWSRNLAVLCDAQMSFLDPRSGLVGEPEPVESGTGTAIVAGFNPAWVVAAIRSQSAHSS